MKILPNFRIVLLIGILFLILLVVFVLWMNKKPPVNEETINPSSPVSSAKPDSFIPEEGRPFEVITTPPSADFKIDEPISFAFSVPVAVEDIVISVEPPTVIEMNLDSTGTTLRVTPESYWAPNTDYVIKILTKTVSINNKTLSKEQVVNFKTQALSGM